MGRNRPRYTPDLHSLALTTASRPDVDALIADLVNGHTPAELTEAGGVLAGSWMATPLACDPVQLVAAAMLLSGPIDRDQLTDWLREGWRRGRGAYRSYDPSAR